MFDYMQYAVRTDGGDRKYVWVAYQKRPPNLPVAVADNVQELARLTGKSEGTIVSCWSKYRHGKMRTCPYHRVRIDP